jgi:transposase
VIPVIHEATASEAVMMGQQIGDQTSLFYEFRLDDRIPKEHLLRRIDLFLTPVLGGMHEQLASYYSEGRPSIDPELMVRMLIVGYCYAFARSLI